jgi:EpsG family
LNTLIPIEFYTQTYYYFVMLLVLVVYAQSGSKVQDGFNFLGIFSMLLIILYIGLRPISGLYFLDMLTYSQNFERIKDGVDAIESGDLGFDFFVIWCAKVMSVENFFLVCAILYIVPMWVLSKKWFDNQWFYAFLMFVGSFTFWAYGTNGIRNGLATSFFLLALAFIERKVLLLLFLVLSYSFHKSLTIPILAFGIAMYFNDPKKYFYVWLLAIPLSLALGSFWENFFASLGFGDDRISYLTDSQDETVFSGTGFRWDFVLYSATGVFAGYYYIFKKGFTDKVYNSILGTYLISNALWILVIRANFSNRFSYLSWFMLGLIIIYPLLKQQLLENQNKKIGNIIFLYFLFTFVMATFITKL